jgi:molybdenum cofactor biosynthesis protein B
VRGSNHHKDLPKNLKFILMIASDTITSRKAKGNDLQDISGEVATSLIKGARFMVLDRVYLPNDVDVIGKKICSIASEGLADVIIISGGTGLGDKDVTIEAVTPLLDKTLPGFGELFRSLSFNSVGTSAIASRALAGIFNGVLIFALPGSPDAVRLALEKIILPEAPHLLKMIQR